MPTKAWAMTDAIVTLYDQIVDQRYKGKEFPDLEWRKQGMYFRIKVSCDCYEDNYRLGSVKWFHIIMLNGHSVFVQTTNDFIHGIPQTGWENSGNHDSCYRQAIEGLVDVGFDVHDEAFSLLPKEIYEREKFNRETNLNFRFDTGFAKIFKYVEVDSKRNEENNYFYDILSVKEIDNV